jgi:hypothetical protein
MQNVWDVTEKSFSNILNHLQAEGWEPTGDESKSFMEACINIQTVLKSWEKRKNARL